MHALQSGFRFEARLFFGWRFWRTALAGLWLVLFVASGARAADQGVPGLVLTNQSLMPDGRASFEVIVPSNGLYTLEVSADLVKWGYGFTLEAVNNRIPIVSPEPVASMRNLFLRARVGRGFYPDLGLHFHLSAGTFGGAFAPTVRFPVTVSSYSAHLDVEDGENFPDGTNVVFTGPAGSGLLNARSGQFAVDTNEHRAWYQSAGVSTPVVPPPGFWTVQYQATNLTFHLPDAEVNTHLMIPVPTAVVAGACCNG